MQVGADSHRRRRLQQWRRGRESDISFVDIRGLNGIRNTLEEGCAGLLSTSDACLAMFATQLSLNGVSTAAHVLSGTVLQPLINVRVPNDKLFYRSLGLVRQFGGGVDF